MQQMIAMDPGPHRDAGTAMLVDSIWNMLPHPPAPVGPTPPQYYYRQADGAFNVSPSPQPEYLSMSLTSPGYSAESRASRSGKSRREIWEDQCSRAKGERV